MGVMYKVIEKGFPGVVGGGEKKFYASIVRGRKVEVRDLVEEIAEANTLQTTDAFAVVVSFFKSCGKHLSEGRIIDLGPLGKFIPSLSSGGEATPEEVDKNSIKKFKVLYRISPLLEKQFSIVDFDKVS
jgi:predicted histone-like DNA-binding protein